MPDGAPIVIAHRGASGYLPEHTLAAKALAYGLGADYLEQDVVATRDDELIVLHDIHLDTVTDVARLFPGRERADGRWYARDFTLQEIRSLSVHERTDLSGAVVFPGRFPAMSGRFQLPTLADEIELVQGLNKSSGRKVGIYPEIKKPAWHRQEGVDVAGLLLELLDGAGYRSRSDPVFLQCFDPAETRRLREELGTDLRIIQLVADDTWNEAEADFAAMLGPDGLRGIAEYADGVGPWLVQLYGPDGPDGQPMGNDVVMRSHEAGLAVHPYTFRADNLPPGFDDYGTLVRWFVKHLRIDGLFTDFPDLTRSAMDRA